MLSLLLLNSLMSRTTSANQICCIHYLAQYHPWMTNETSVSWHFFFLLFRTCLCNTSARCSWKKQQWMLLLNKSELADQTNFKKRFTFLRFFLFSQVLQLECPLRTHTTPAWRTPLRVKEKMDTTTKQRKHNTRRWHAHTRARVLAVRHAKKKKKHYSPRPKEEQRMQK